MKAKIIPEPKRVLLWNCSPGSDQYIQLEELCRRYGLEPKAVGGMDAGKTVGFLCGFRGASQAAALLALADDAYPPALILCGLEREKVSEFVDKVNDCGMQIPLKAMVTIHNRDWMLSQLLEELVRERKEWEGKEV